MVLLFQKIKIIEMRLKNIGGSGLSNVKKASGSSNFKKANGLKSVRGSGLKFLNKK